MQRYQEDEEGLTAKEACEFLGISRSTLERYAAEDWSQSTNVERSEQYSSNNLTLTDY